MGMMDIVSLQEMLVSYRKLLEWLPAINEEEEAMRDDRFHLLDYLIDKLEMDLEVLKDGGISE